VKRGRRTSAGTGVTGGINFQRNDQGESFHELDGRRPLLEKGLLNRGAEVNVLIEGIQGRGTLLKEVDLLRQAPKQER